MNTRDLQIILKIVDYKRVTRTAEYFRMTQPAVSSTLKRIEDERCCGTHGIVRRLARIRWMLKLENAR